MYEEINKIKIYARDNRIPIMLDDCIDFLCEYIKKNRIKNILEIGTAIGYSAIRMARVNKDIRIVTIEKDELRYKMAVQNVSTLGMKKQIKVIYADAMEAEIEGKYDLIFIDASKSHNIFFMQKFSKNLAKCGTIITDNLSFHGLVENPNLIKTKNQASLVRKIKEYIDFLDQNKEFTTTYVDVGDRIAISKRVDENEITSNNK